MSNNGSPENCCKVSNEHIIGYMLEGQNGGSTIRLLFVSKSSLILMILMHLYCFGKLDNKVFVFKCSFFLWSYFLVLKLYCFGRLND